MFVNRPLMLCGVSFLFAVLLILQPSVSLVAGQETKLFGGTFRVAFSQDPLNMNGILKFWNPVGYVNAFILNKLVNFGENYEIKGDLAKSWVLADDQKSIMFKLRDDVWWSDGVKFTSADVKWHYQMLMNGTSVARPQLSTLVGIDTPDDYTVTFRFSGPKNLYTMMLPFGLFSTAPDQRILPKHVYRWGTGFNFTDNPANVYMPSTGPFLISDFVSGQSMTFIRNPKFTGTHPAYFDKVIFQFIPSPTTALASLESGQVDLVHESVGVPVQDLARVSKLPGITLSGAPYFTTWRITFNFGEMSVSKYPWVNDERVRRAVSYAIDRDSIIKTVLSGITSPVYGPISPLIKDWYNPQITKYEFDTSKAEALLDEAGYKKDASGVRIKAPVVIYQTSLVFAEVIKSMLAKVGIVVDLNPVEDVSFFSKYETGPQGLAEFPMGIQTFAGGPLPFNIETWTSGKRFSPNGQNCGFYNNARVTELETLATQTNDLSKIREYYNEVQAIIAREQPYVFLWGHWKINAWKSEYKGILESSLPAPAWYGSGLLEAWWTKGRPTLEVVQTTRTQAPTAGTDLTPIAEVAVVVVLALVGAAILIRRRGSRKQVASKTA